MLVNDGEAIVDYIDQKNGLTPLMYSIINKNYEMMMLFLNCGASVKMCDFKCVTPLMLACQVGQLKMVQILADSYHADVDTQDENGLCALHYAVIANKPDILKYLVCECGADRHLKDNNKKKA